jgi:hypothetical protein
MISQTPLLYQNSNNQVSIGRLINESVIPGSVSDQTQIYYNMTNPTGNTFTDHDDIPIASAIIQQPSQLTVLQSFSASLLKFVSEEKTSAQALESVTLTNTGSITVVSDQRMKTDIVPQKLTK